DAPTRERIFAGARQPLTESEKVQLRRLLDPPLRRREQLPPELAHLLAYDTNAQAMCQLAEAWLALPSRPAPAMPAGFISSAAGTRKRVAAARAALSRGEAGPPLCAPTRA